MEGTSRVRSAELTAVGLVCCRGNSFLRLLRRAGLPAGFAAPSSGGGGLHPGGQRPDGACALASSLSKWPAQKPAETTEPPGDAPTGDSPVTMPLATCPCNPVSNKKLVGNYRFPACGQAPPSRGLFWRQKAFNHFNLTLVCEGL